jgi:hypothetical protein
MIWYCCFCIAVRRPAASPSGSGFAYALHGFKKVKLTHTAMLTLSHESRRDLPQTHAHAPRVEYAREQALVWHQRVGSSKWQPVRAVARFAIMLATLPLHALQDDSALQDDDRSNRPCCTSQPPCPDTFGPGSRSSGLTAPFGRWADPWDDSLFASPAASSTTGQPLPLRTYLGQDHRDRSVGYGHCLAVEEASSVNVSAPEARFPATLAAASAPTYIKSTALCQYMFLC